MKRKPPSQTTSHQFLPIIAESIPLDEASLPVVPLLVPPQSDPLSHPTVNVSPVTNDSAHYVVSGRPISAVLELNYWFKLKILLI